MSKKRHSKDKLYLTPSEYRDDWGGYKKKKEQKQSVLPFYCCCLSLQPFDNPVCTQDGDIFDIINIIPFIKKYGQNPMNGQKLRLQDMIKLNLYRNKDNQFHDPISYKVFTEFTTIVAIKTTGNVFSLDTVYELNKKPKFWKDLITDETFTSKDIIYLQNPKDMKCIENFDYIIKNIKFTCLKNQEQLEQELTELDYFQGKRLDQNVTWNITSKKVMQQLQKQESEKDQIRKKVKQDQEQKDNQEKEDFNLNRFYTIQQFIDYVIKYKWYYSETFSSGKNNMLITTTTGDTQGEERRLLTESEIREKIHQIVKQNKIKSYIQIVTNIGFMDFELYSDIAPMACENFIELTKKKYYDETVFHRLINNFIIQGGDPTGTGAGGQSVFGKSFKDEFDNRYIHDDVGILGMSNSGPNTNNSQFYITLGKSNHLDKKHTIFGKITGGLSVLERINKIKSNHKQVPIQSIIIQKVGVIQDAFLQAINVLKELKKDQERLQEKQKIQLEREKIKWIDDSSEFNLEGFKTLDQKKEKSLAHSLLYD